MLPTVLLIDDDMVSREVMATVLTMGGFAVHTAAGGAAALELLAGGTCEPGVILMDAQMPGLSGTGLIAELRARCLANIYAMSASQAPEEIAAAADGFLLKPFGAEELRSMVQERDAQAKADAAPIEEASEPVVNAEILAQLREMMPEAAVRQIYAAIVADLGKRLAALEAALEKGDGAEARRIGHAIKGGCGMAGAQQAAQLGARIESGEMEAGKAGQRGNYLDNGQRMLGDLRAARENLERMLEAEFPA
jgi:CheY-like chemotaxis protein